MPHFRPRLDPQHLQDLKAGLDRDGETRTWAEVAQLLGLSTPYVRRVGSGRMARKPAVVWIDPRDIIPQFATTMTDEFVLAWNEDPRCLCGCGEESFQECGNKGKVPYGAYRLFRGAHEKRMPWIRIRIVDANKEALRRKRLGLARRKENVQAGIIVDLLNEWKIVNDKRGFTDLGTRAHLAPNHLRDIAAGRHERIQKKTAAKILAALGEPMRPEIFSIYKEWAISQGKEWKHIEVIK